MADRFRYPFKGGASPTVSYRVGASPSVRLILEDVLLAEAVATISGSATFAFTPSAQINGLGDVAGAATIVFAPSGAVFGLGDIAGSTVLAFVPLGVVMGLGNVLGAATLFFSPSGALENGEQGEQQSAALLGDDASSRSKRPIVTIRPKIERDLDDALETLEAIPESDRPPAKREAIRAARTILKAVEAPPAYRAKLAAIDLTLARAARAAAVHQGISAALASAAADLQSLTEELERKRLQRRRNEAIIWLLAA
jgi:hypothetical protein